MSPSLSRGGAQCSLRCLPQRGADALCLANSNCRNLTCDLTERCCDAVRVAIGKAMSAGRMTETIRTRAPLGLGIGISIASSKSKEN